MDARRRRRARIAQSAAALKERFNRDWWVEDEQFFALALDPDKRQVRAVTSNVGHCLACGIIDRERLPAVVGRMFAPDMFSGWGIRTLSSDARVLQPAELPPRHGVGRRAGDDRLRPAPVRFRRAGARSRRGRSSIWRSSTPTTGSRSASAATRAASARAGRLPAREHAAALERDRLSARRADDARAAADRRR